MQVFVNGIISGLTLAVLALAFSVVYLPTGVFHIALAGIYVIVPFIAWTCLRLGWSWFLVLPLAVLTGVCLSLACEMINHGPLARRKASMGAHLISSLGISISMVQAVVLIWGNQTRMLRIGLDWVMTFKEITLTQSQIISFLASLACLFLFLLWLKFSDIGLQFRALADNPGEVALKGYNIAYLRLMAFGVSGILCSISALSVSHDMGFDPNGGLISMILAIVAVLIGGRGSFVGPILGGVLLGLVRAETLWFLPARWQDGVTFLILCIFLCLLPNGLVGRQARLEAKL